MRLVSTLAAAAVLLSLGAAPALAAPTPDQVRFVQERAAALQPKVVAWRRDFHAHPELAYEEVRTAAAVAAHLKRLGFEVRTGVAKTGVVGVLRGGRPGPVVALRADMDALPVKEATGLPFASTRTGTYEGRAVPIAHACGHDAHVAMLMGAAELLAGLRAEIPGTIVFLFQPAEEGAPPGVLGGAAAMVEAGVLRDLKVEAVFGLHVTPGEPGSIAYRAEGFMAAADRIDITLRGKQTHGAWPWQGIDVISLGAEVVQALNTVAARQMDVTVAPLVLTVATVNAGARFNIIPDELTMSGTLRTFDPAQREEVKRRIVETVEARASSYGAKAEVRFLAAAPVTWNDAALSRAVLPSLEAAAGPGRVNPAARPTTIAEDFGVFQQHVPGVFFHLGVTAPGVAPKDAPPNHSPYFDVHEPAMETGVRALSLAVLGWLESRR